MATSSVQPPHHKGGVRSAYLRQVENEVRSLASSLRAVEEKAEALDLQKAWKKLRAVERRLHDLSRLPEDPTPSELTNMERALREAMRYCTKAVRSS
ncbi:MAG TPA: hypothetical protein VJB60_02420 [Candidatus Peribacterales bacterium]|nr:hypothetical protein [Candidatus Peribacterales bacterium]